MKWLIIVLMVVLVSAGLVAGCGSTKTLVKKEIVYVKVPVTKPCPDPGPQEKVEYAPIKFVPPSHLKAAACLTWHGLRNLLSNMVACKAAYKQCQSSLDGYRSQINASK